MCFSQRRSLADFFPLSLSRLLRRIPVTARLVSSGGAAAVQLAKTWNAVVGILHLKLPPMINQPERVSCSRIQSSGPRPISGEACNRNSTAAFTWMGAKPPVDYELFNTEVLAKLFAQRQGGEISHDWASPRVRIRHRGSKEAEPFFWNYGKGDGIVQS